jgi:uncharacterized protein YndB with AHSA1/START domain
VPTKAQKESATKLIAASPAAVFDLVTDPAKLPAWNLAITEVVEAPQHLEAGSTWKVRIHALGRSWVSRSRVSMLDPTNGRFAYRSQTDDDNPSYADWEWLVEPRQNGSFVTVSVELHPLSFWRKHLVVKIRRPLLRNEILNSLVALDSALHLARASAGSIPQSP